MVKRSQWAIAAMAVGLLTTVSLYNRHRNGGGELAELHYTPAVLTRMRMLAQEIHQILNTTAAADIDPVAGFQMTAYGIAYLNNLQVWLGPQSQDVGEKAFGLNIVASQNLLLNRQKQFENRIRNGQPRV